MDFKDLKITAVKVEGPCSRTKLGDTFYVRNACVEIPPGEKVCIFALGSLLQPLSGAIIRNEPGQGILDLLQDWQCPDSEARVVFHIEEEKKDNE
jgi:uncharacterized repeat protein (TIGR04076 family)